MTNPTQEQRGVSEPLCKCGHTYFMHEGCEIEACCESDGKDFCECEKYEPVEQGASMGPELRKRIEFSKLDNSHPATHCLRLLVDFNISVGKACEYLSKYFLTGQRDPIANEVGPYDPMLDEVAASEIARQLRASREEVSKLSTRIDEYELAETKAVEELARVRDLLKEYIEGLVITETRMRMAIQGQSIRDVDETLSYNQTLLTKARKLLAPKPLDTNEGGEPR